MDRDFIDFTDLALTSITDLTKSNTRYKWWTTRPSLLEPESVDWPFHSCLCFCFLRLCLCYLCHSFHSRLRHQILSSSGHDSPVDHQICPSDSEPSSRVPLVCWPTFPCKKMFSSLAEKNEVLSFFTKSLTTYAIMKREVTSLPLLLSESLHSGYLTWRQGKLPTLRERSLLGIHWFMRASRYWYGFQIGIGRDSTIPLLLDMARLFVCLNRACLDFVQEGLAEKIMMFGAWMKLCLISHKALL